MGLFDRTKAILLNPQKEWEVIDAEGESHAKVLASYVLPLTVFMAIAVIIGYGLIGYSMMGHRMSNFRLGFTLAVTMSVAMVLNIYLAALAVNALAANFNSRKDFDKAFSLVAHSYTPMLVGGIFHLIPGIAALASVVSIYSLYLLYTGLQAMMRTPAEKKTVYFVVSIICLAAMYFVSEMIFKAVATGIMMSGVRF
ncbi:MAG: YIP1 family protein [Bacteroidales bacterium]|nr:YIP1 family protein [Bacteroidales bacterium]